MLEFSKHARLQMERRGITEENVFYALWNFQVFKYQDDYVLHLWGRADNGIRLRISMIPEISYIITVCEVSPVQVRHQLAAKSL